jgi:hypothetical protein
MACDFSALANIDASDVTQSEALLRECIAVMTDPTLWFWGIAFTVVGALVGAWIGKYKKAIARDAVLGAAFGPIGWIVSLMLPVKAPPPTCAACKREVAPGDAHCRHCGAALKP